MTAASIPSYGATSSSPDPTCNEDSDRTLANTPRLRTSENSTRDGYDSHGYDTFPTERSRLIAPSSPSLLSQSDADPTLPVRTDHERPKQPQNSSRVLIITLGLLCFLMMSILFIGFLLPEVAQEYSKTAADLRLSSLSLDSFTQSGARVRVRARVAMNATKVKGFLPRSVGILAGSVARQVKLGSSEVSLYLPEYPDGMIGTVVFPDIVVNLGNGQATDIDMLCDIVPGHLDGVKPALSDYLAGKIHSIRVQGESDIPVRSGILPLGTHRIVQEVIFREIPTLPSIELSRLNLAEIDTPERKALGANVTVSVQNKYPINIAIPPLGFSVLLLSCEQEFIEIAVAQTSTINIQPHQPIVADVAGVIQSIPFALIETCPGTGTSPLDDLLGQYVQGHCSTAYIRGLPFENTNPSLPAWVGDILSSVTIPIPFPGGHAFKDLLKSFSLNDVKFQLPDPSAEPGAPEASPRLSATVQAIVRLPQEMNAPLDVSKILANADIFYMGKKLGEFHFPTWAAATTVQNDKAHELEVDARVEDVPLNITDPDVFSEVAQKIIFGGGGVKLQAVGTADVKVGIASLGAFVIRGIPAQGDVMIKGGNYTLDEVHPQPNEITIISSTRTSVKLGANITFNNPTNYTANIPYINIAFMKNDTLLGNGTARDISVTLGRNNAIFEAFWAPAEGGDAAWDVGAVLLGDYVSGKNTTITVKLHGKSLPTLPDISKALSALKFEIPLPRIPQSRDPDSPDEPTDPSRFVQSATLHLASSTGTFVLNNPLKKDTIFMTNLTGFASHEGVVLGTLNYTYQFAIPPGISETPKLPVDWTLNGVGYDILKKAIGGILKIDAKAQSSIKLGQWEDRLSFEGNGIGAHVRF
ncbi:hypothetical protein H072_9344 [Dactylellina haptotyla CBS 200.50]|uniref:Pre-rRNA processing protein n=1 Tax=Dactylellina haptotyla (strain CBS 200.50) TaxID=1284197 RepID=S8BPC2_DACHA|nr:hypothetical protein H072_9344 [Dactylellina haptotyla CBS 200.50]